MGWVEKIRKNGENEEIKEQGKRKMRKKMKNGEKMEKLEKKLEKWGKMKKLKRNITMFQMQVDFSLTIQRFVFGNQCIIIHSLLLSQITINQFLDFLW